MGGPIFETSFGVIAVRVLDRRHFRGNLFGSTACEKVVGGAGLAWIGDDTCALLAPVMLGRHGGRTFSYVPHRANSFSVLIANTTVGQGTITCVGLLSTPGSGDTLSQ